MSRDRMHWPSLLSHHRVGGPSAAGAGPRSEFQRDFDRIVFSSAFRRLQDKTQVFPLAKNDSVRTRLTHSLEVASVGRSLGVLAGDHVLRAHTEMSETGYTAGDFGAVVAAACLAHDIGNPPFGHAGEAAIQSWFNASRLGRSVLARDRVYQSAVVLNLQSPGAAILWELLDAFVGAVEAAASGSTLPRAREVLGLLPGQFLGADGGPAAGLYARVLAITDFVSGMTDSYAVAVAAKLRALEGRP